MGGDSATWDAKLHFLLIDAEENENLCSYDGNDGGDEVPQKKSRIRV